jgi:predicted TIM-barrel fold metal-dependent hydrolase
MAVEPIIDVNVTLGQWPARRVPWDDVQKLAEKLRANDVAEAWCGSYDGLFHNDLSDVNDRLVKMCEQASNQNSDSAPLQLRPFGEINPLLSDWENELERCAAQHRMLGVRLHPNYHGYALTHPAFAEVLGAAAARNLIVQLTVLMEDERMMHPLMRVPPVNLAPLAEVVKQIPGLRLVLLNALKGKPATELIQLLNVPGVHCDIAMLEGAAALETLIVEIPPDKILFGSHAPSLYFESARLKLQESALPAPYVREITHSNSRSLAGEK